MNIAEKQLIKIRSLKSFILKTFFEKFLNNRNAEYEKIIIKAKGWVITKKILVKKNKKKLECDLIFSELITL